MAGKGAVCSASAYKAFREHDPLERVGNTQLLLKTHDRETNSPHKCLIGEIEQSTRYIYLDWFELEIREADPGVSQF